jgi:hypothetical protein
MTKSLVALLLGLIAAVVWLVMAFLMGAALPLMAHIAFDPASFIKDHVLPHGTAAMLFGRESQGAHHYTFALVALALWWSILSIGAWFLLKRAAPNNSFKGKPLRGSA